jgi:hypothetical protein
MGLFDIFRKKKTMTLEEVVKKMKKEGCSDKEIKEKLMGEVSEKDTPSVGGHNNTSLIASWLKFELKTSLYFVKTLGLFKSAIASNFL